MKNDIPETHIPRRSFLRYAGAATAVAGLSGTASCHKDHKVIPDNGVDIGAGDNGIFNYAYALEQLEVSFYAQVLATPYAGMNSTELAYFTAIHEHEVIHAGFFKTVLGGNAIPDLVPDFGAVDFSSRTSVLTAAKMFEDTGVSAYAGTAYLIRSADRLSIFGKILSVEARHAATIGNMIALSNYLSNQVGSNGLNSTLSIGEVLVIANQFLKTRLNAASFNYIQP